MAQIDLPLFLLLSLALTITPGPDILLVATVGLTQGRRQALPMAWGMALGNIAHTALVALGVASLLASTPSGLDLLRWGGAAYLGFIGLRLLLQPKAHSAEEPVRPPARSLIWFRRGLIMNLLNPKVLIFFLAFLPQFLPLEATRPVAIIAGLGAIFIAQTLVVFSIVAIASDYLGRHGHGRPHWNRWAPRLSGVVFLGLGLHLLISHGAPIGA